MEMSKTDFVTSNTNNIKQTVDKAYLMW
jgi:hypothetical protein